jgi:hypothetical protein
MGQPGILAEAAVAAVVLVLPVLLHLLLLVVMEALDLYLPSQMHR